MRIRYFAGGAAALTVAVLATATPVAASAQSDAGTRLLDMVPALADPQTSKDRVPDSVELDELGGVDPGSTRLLGHDEAASYWVGLADASTLCLIVELPDEGVAGASCGSILDFYDRGAALRVEGREGGPKTEAYLVPAGIDLPSALKMPNLRSDASSAGSSFVAFPNDLSRSLEPTTIVRDSGESFEFYPLNQGGK